MLTYRYTTFFLFVVLASWADAACSFNSPVFEGSLNVEKTDEYGFATVLATPEDDLSQIFLDCSEGTIATLRVLPPERADNHVPSLRTKPRSFFIFRGERYGGSEERKSALITGGIEGELIRLGIIVGNGEEVLLASDDYQYFVRLQLTIEAEDDAIISEETMRTIEFVLDNGE